tara:strand:- start:57 stop:1886 length:1830 start_codon:yes stop_codon:yes gene_type:complete
MSEVKAIGKITPYEFQHELIEASKDHIRGQWAEVKSNPLKKSCDPVIIEAYVSAGKTIVIGALVNYCNGVGAKTLVLTRTGELVSQNAEECWNMDAKNSIFSASLNIKSTKHSTIVGTEGSVANALNKELANFTPHVIIIDECHEPDWRDVINKGETQYSKILNHFMARNPKVAIVGLTGTPFRGTESIIGPFWKKRVGPRIDREFLVDGSFIVPTIFGYTDVEYDMSKFDKFSEGTQDFSAGQLKEMGDNADVSQTHEIMKEVVRLTKDRLGVLVTCASEKHCQEASSILEEGTYGIVTQSTSALRRAEILKLAKQGKMKFVFQIGCLTTGVNVPYWDTSVILRRIGSLTLLIQLMGRSMRNLKEEHLEKGWHKVDHLCLDFSGTMEAMQQMFDDPILDEAVLEKSKSKQVELKKCPSCNTMNSKMARRCINKVRGPAGIESRCEHFFVSKDCPKCSAKNDTTARDCRACGETMIDPNKALTNKHYSQDDWKTVTSMSISPTRNDGVSIKIFFDCKDFKGNMEVAKMFYNPFSQGGRRYFENNFIAKFGLPWKTRKKIMAIKNIGKLLEELNKLETPVKATHRIGEKNNSIVHGMKFINKTTMGGKEV